MEATLLSALHNQIKNCTRCHLHESRINAVPGEGNHLAVLMIVGEAPGADEDVQGRPFVGQSGQLLRQTIREAGISLDDVFIGNTLKCRPPENREPTLEETEVCRGWLFAQISLISPKLIMPLGNPALKLLLPQQGALGISKVRGRLIQKDGLTFLPSFHPSFLLRRGGNTQEYIVDFLKAKDYLEGRL